MGTIEVYCEYAGWNGSSRIQMSNIYYNNYTLPSGVTMTPVTVKWGYNAGDTRDIRIDMSNTFHISNDYNQYIYCDMAISCGPETVSGIQHCFSPCYGITECKLSLKCYSKDYTEYVWKRIS